ncbi:MAG TPA: S41 family peptidase [Candidatus Melainabacteria bacterium]|nr:S41 family peptidase [Candidatus Melainabacteria bacterium]
MVSKFKAIPRWMLFAAGLVIAISIGQLFSGAGNSSQYDPSGCQAANRGAFDGKTLYTCAVMAVAERHRELVDHEKRHAFIDRWLHKFDDTGAFDSEEGTLKAMSEMVLSLKGRFDFIFTPSAVAHNEIIEKGQLAGIGASVAMPAASARNGQPQIRLPEHATPQLIALLKLDRAPEAVIDGKNPMVVLADPEEGTPAFRGGLKKGDIVYAVDDGPVAGKTLDEVLALIRGEPGTRVKVTVLRQGEKVDLELTRAIVDLKTTAEKRMDDVGYVRISHFESMRVVSDLHKSIDVVCGTDKSVQAESAADCASQSLIIDLRGNPGGRFDAVVLVSELFLDSGDLSSVMMRDGDETVRSDFKLEKDNLVVRESGKSASYRRQFALHFPLDRRLVVLVDEFSASGAEAMATILQKQRHAIVVGAQTRGKGVGQCSIELPYGYAANFICMEYLAGGKAVDWVGVTPDVVFNATPESAQDSQMELALRIARGESVEIPDAQSVSAHEQQVVNARKKAYEEEVADTLSRFFH